MQKAAFADDSKYLSLMSDSEWYDVVFLILEAASQIALELIKGINVFVHCSDGWDRTAQLCSLSAIYLDPYYRSIEGFQILIEKDWVHFGHQFGVRLAQGVNDPTSDEKSQVFLQFLDCVSQLLHQFPTEFEFNFKYLQYVAEAAYNNLFGTFLFNCELEMRKAKVMEKTVSLWSYIASHKKEYSNEFYYPKAAVLEIDTNVKNHRYWKEHFLQYVHGFEDVYHIYSCNFTE